MREYGSNINLPSLDNLFSSEQERQDAKLEKIQILPLTELHLLWPCLPLQMIR